MNLLLRPRLLLSQEHWLPLALELGVRVDIEFGQAVSSTAREKWPIPTYS